MASNTGTLLKLLFHAIAVMYHLLIFNYMHRLEMPDSSHLYVKNMKRFSFRFFTMWNFTLQCSYFVLCIIDDVLQLTSNSFQESVKRTKQYLFRTFVFPLSCSVAFLFWSMFLVDRKLVFPPEVDQILPPWVNHALHSNIVFIVLMEMATTFYWYPRAKTHALIGITTYLLAYGTCYFLTYFFHGIWLYPVYEMLNWTQRIVLAVFTYVLTVGFYFFGEGLNAKIWETEMKKNSHKKVKVK